jgi:hypothetical protein
VRGNATLLTTYAGAKILQGDGRPALASLRALALRHRESTAMPTLVSTMIGNVIANFAAPRLVHTGLARGVWSDTELTGLDATLAALDLRDAIARSLTAETEFGSAILIEWAEGRTMPHPLLVSDFGLAYPAALYRAAAYHREAMRQLVAPYHKTSDWDRVRISATHQTLERDTGSAESRFCQLAIPAHAKVTATCAGTAIRINSARIALALERHRRAHGTYPENLDALAPAFLPALPGNRPCPVSR